jgi:hypothetical protein
MSRRLCRRAGTGTSKAGGNRRKPDGAGGKRAESGEHHYYLDGEEIGHFDVKAAENIDRITYFYTFRNLLERLLMMRA